MRCDEVEIFQHFSTRIDKKYVKFWNIENPIKKVEIYSDLSMSLRSQLLKVCSSAVPICSPFSIFITNDLPSLLVFAVILRCPTQLYLPSIH